MNSSSLIEKVNRVVVFTDVHNFSVAARVLAERQYDFLQEMYETLGEIVVQYEGELVKYLGDGFICAFAGGKEKEAVASALAMRAAFSKMVAQWNLPPETELEVGVGTGEVAIGVFGHRSLRLREVYGEVVNQAAKIGHHRGIAITEPVYERVKDTYPVRRLADLTVKWAEEPLRVWEIEEADPQAC